MASSRVLSLVLPDPASRPPRLLCVLRRAVQGLGMDMDSMSTVARKALYAFPWLISTMPGGHWYTQREIANC
jgi:hypothetical protein